MAHHTWEDVGVLAHTKPTKHRPVTSYKVSEGAVTLYGTPYRAVVVHSSAQDKRRPQRLARDIQTSSSIMQPAALGLMLLLALLLGRWMERTRRPYVGTTRAPWPGWDKTATERPTAFMMITQFAGVIVFKCGHDRQRARPLSVVQQ